MSEAAMRSGVASRAGITRVLSDDSLARRAVKGDERAFAAIFDRYHQSLYRFCLATVGNAQDAQDALQNTMVKVLRALPGEERKIELKPWLYRIAHNESIELLRRRRETQQLDPELAGPGSGLAEEAAVRERLRQLLADLDELPERQRETLVMRELAGLDFAEIGAALGTSAAVVRQTLYEARVGLRQMDKGRNLSCEDVTKALSDGDGRVGRRRDLRAHLRACESCRAFRGEIEGRERDLAALTPLPALAAAGLLQGLLGGAHSSAAAGGLAGALGGGAAKTLGVSTALKGAATVAVVAAIGVGAADRGGLIDAGLPGGGTTPAPKHSAGDGSAGAQPAPAPAGAGGVSAAARAEGEGRGGLGASHPANSSAGNVAGAGAGKTSVEADTAPTSQGNSVSHPHGKGHEKQLPSASAHGQQTAAAHKTAKHGSAGTKSHPAHPIKPSHPPRQSSNHGAETGSSSPPSNAGAPEANSQPSAAPPAGTEEAPLERETGKKP